MTAKREEVCRKEEKARRRSKTLRFPFSGENCRWIVLWRHLYQTGAEGANGAQRLESLRQKDRGCLIFYDNSYQFHVSGVLRLLSNGLLYFPYCYVAKQITEQRHEKFDKTNVKRLRF